MPTTAETGFLLIADLTGYTEYLSRSELDVEARWQAESTSRRVVIDDRGLLLDLEAAIVAEPAVVWAHLTAPKLRTRWEGPLVIDETLPDGRRGVGAVAQCVTGRLATLEEIVDWQPYEHVGWRLAVPGIGPVAAAADLEAVDGGTRLRLRWAYGGEAPVYDAEIARIRLDKEAAFGRLAKLVAGALPVLEPA